MKTPNVILISIALLVFAAVVYTGFSRPTVVPPNLTDDATITQARFNEKVGQTDRAVLVKFGAPWCPPCVQIDKELPMVASELGSDIDIIKINVDNNPDIAAQHNVTRIPRMVLYRDGQIISTRMGMMGSQELVSWIRNTQ